MSEVPKLERVNKKKQVPRHDQFLFMLLLKMNCSGSPKGTPHDRCRRTKKKMQWKPLELGGVPQKIDV